jgi:hypothetical protein
MSYIKITQEFLECGTTEAVWLYISIPGQINNNLLIQYALFIVLVQIIQFFAFVLLSLFKIYNIVRRMYVLHKDIITVEVIYNRKEKIFLEQ